MPAVTPDVAWAIVRKNHAFIMKRPNLKAFSKETYNLKNIHSKKYNGFVNKQVIDVGFGYKNKGLVIKNSKATFEKKPAKHFMTREVKASDKRALRLVRVATRGEKCRTDLEMTALAKASRILRAERKITGEDKKVPKRKRFVKKSKKVLATKEKKVSGEKKEKKANKEKKDLKKQRKSKKVAKKAGKK